MTVGSLREMLEDIDDNVEVKIALQPSYPMRGRVRNVCLERNEDYAVKALWIAASDNIDYDVPKASGLSLTSIPMTMKRRTSNGKSP